MRSTWPALLLLFALLGLATARADEADSCDQDCARVLVTEGKILPLSEILKMTQAEITGEIVEIELEAEDGLWVYEVKMIDADGRLVELEIDAASGRVLEQEVGQ